MLRIRGPAAETRYIRAMVRLLAYAVVLVLAVSAVLLLSAA